MAEYIERDALLEDIENTLVFSGRPNHENPKQMAARLVVQRIRCAPAADVAPAVHGKWIKRGNEKKCSVCEFIYYSNNDEWNGCPNCLARMDGE